MNNSSAGSKLLQAAYQKGKMYWISVLLTVCLCYGFTLSHSSIGVDDESFQRFYLDGDLLKQGRFFHILFRYIFDSYLYLPFWRDFIGLVLLVAGTALMGYTNRLYAGDTYSNTCDTIFACITLSFPFLSNVFIFSMSTLELGLNTLVGSACIYYCYYGFFESNKNLKPIAYFLLFSILCAIMGQSGILYLFSCGTLSFMLFFLYKKPNTAFIIILKRYLIFAVTLLLGMLVSRFLCQYIQAAYGIKQSNYIENYVQYDLSSFGALLQSCLKFLAGLPLLLWSKAKDSFGMSVYIGAIVIFSCLTAYRIIRTGNVKVLGVGLFTIISTTALYIITGNSTLPNRALIDLRLFSGLVAALAFLCLTELFRNKTFVRRAVFFGVILVVLNQSKMMNRIFFTDYTRYQLDLNMVHSVGTMLKGPDGAFGKKPVVFLGVPQPYNLDSGEVEGISVFSWDRMYSENEETKEKRIYPFMRLHGYFVTAPAYFNEELVRTQVAQMPAWPEEGCVKDLGDYILVKLGIPLYMQFNMKSEEFLEKYRGNMPCEGYAEWLHFDGQTRSFDVGGWAILQGIASQQVVTSIVLVGVEVQYVLSTYAVDSQDVTSYVHDGINYDTARYQVFPRSLPYLNPGKYDVFSLLESNDMHAVIPLGNINVD